MSVLINGMKMPKDCGHCKCRYITHVGKLVCQILSQEVKMKEFGKRPKNCPLIEVLSPHGRLIDADALNTHDVSPIYEFCVMGVTEEDIGLAETIIEAEGSET